MSDLTNTQIDPQVPTTSTYSSGQILTQIPVKKSPLPIIFGVLIAALLGICGFLGLQVYRLNQIIQVDNTPDSQLTSQVEKEIVPPPSSSSAPTPSSTPTDSSQYKAYEITMTKISNKTYEQITTAQEFTTTQALLEKIFNINTSSIKSFASDTSKVKEYQNFNTRSFQLAVLRSAPDLKQSYSNEDFNITVKKLSDSEIPYLLDPKYCSIDSDCTIRSNFCNIGSYNKYHPYSDVWGCGPGSYEVSPDKSSTIYDLTGEEACGVPEVDYTGSTCVKNKCQAQGFKVCPNKKVN